MYDEKTGLRKGPEPQHGDFVHYVDQVNGKASACIPARVNAHGGMMDQPEPPHYKDSRTVILSHPDDYTHGVAGWCNQDYHSRYPCSKPGDRHFEQSVDGAGRPVVESRWHWPE